MFRFVFQFGEFTGDGGTDWPNIIISAIVSLLSALIGAGVAIGVYRNSLVVQRAKEQEDQSKLEKNRLKYLGFLMNDVFASINHIKNMIIKFKAQIKNIPTEVPTIRYYSLHSLSIISNRLNQEDYYQASVNQLNNDQTVEMFYLVNTVFPAYNHLIDYYNERGKEIQVKQAIIHNYLNALIDEVSNLIMSNQNGELKNQLLQNYAEELFKLSKINSDALDEYHADINLYYSKCIELFVRPVLNLIIPHAHLPELTSIGYKAVEFENHHLSIINDLVRLGKDFEFLAVNVQNLGKRLELVSEPLRLFYLANIKNEESVFHHNEPQL